MTHSPTDSFTLEDFVQESNSEFAISQPPRGVSLPARLILLFRRWQFAVLGFLSVFLSTFGAGCDWRDLLIRPVPMSEAGQIIRCQKTNVKVNDSPVFEVFFEWKPQTDGPSRSGSCFSFSSFPPAPCEMERCGQSVRPTGTTFGLFGNGWLLILFLLVMIPASLLLLFFGLRSGLRELRLLRWGSLCRAQVLRSEQTHTKINDHVLVRVFLSFTSPETGEVCETRLFFLEPDVPADGTFMPILVNSRNQSLNPEKLLKVLKLKRSGDFGAKPGTVFSSSIFLIFFIGLDFLFFYFFSK